MGNFINYLTTATIVGMILGFIVFMFTNDQDISIFLGFLALVGIMVNGFSNKCDDCGNLGALKVTNSDLVDEDEDEQHYYKRENVGSSLHQDNYGYESRTDNYQDVSYVDVIANRYYKDTLVCENCGTTYTRNRTESNKKTYRT